MRRSNSDFYPHKIGVSIAIIIALIIGCMIGYLLGADTPMDIITPSDLMPQTYDVFLWA